MVTIKVQFLLIAFLLFNNSYNAAMATEDADTKASKIYSFAKYVNWPPSDEALIFCVGAPDVADSLRNIIKGKKIANRELQIDTSGCEVSFGSTNTSKEGVLTISDGRGCDSGAIFDFYKENGKLEFSYNKAANNRSGLSINTQALKLAKKRC